MSKPALLHTSLPSVKCLPAAACCFRGCLACRQLAGHVMVPGVRHQQSHARAGVKLPACGWPSLSTGSTSSQQVARGSRTLTFAKRRKKATGAQMLTRQVLSVPACMLQLIAVDWLMTVKVHTHYIYSEYNLPSDSEAIELMSSFEKAACACMAVQWSAC